MHSKNLAAEDVPEEYERAVIEFAGYEAKKILKEMRSGHKPDMIDRIILRIARRNKKGSGWKLRKIAKSA